MGKCQCGSYAINIDPARKVCDVCFYKLKLIDLLAIIHRDGGHFVEKEGIEKAFKKACKTHLNLRSKKEK